MDPTGMNAMNQARPLSFLLGTGIVPQIVLSIALAALLYTVLMAMESVYRSYKQITGTRVEVLPYTVSADDKPREFVQNPKAPNSTFLPLSDNERTGAEFSYSFWLWVNPSSFSRSEEGLLHVMHKGNPSPFPLMGPGVFLHSNTNKMRVYMNSSKTWNNYIDIDNLPVKKWIHVVVLARMNSIEVYINGNIAKKLTFDDAVLYQNFGNLYCFSQRPCIINSANVASLGTGILQIFGTYSGSLSALNYFSYALSYTEIQSLMADGPSKRTDTMDMAAPQYLEDAWWVKSASR